MDAVVVCKQLGYTDGAAIVNTFGPGEGMIWMENVKCNGTESRLSDCPFSGWGLTFTNHSQDIGVTWNSKYS